YQDNVEQDYLDISADFSIVPNTSPPSLDAPADNLIVNCGPSQQAIIQAWLNNNGGAVATQYCDNFFWTNDYNGISNDCGNTGSALVTFTAQDDCGSTSTVAELEVVDINPPNMVIYPQNLQVECDGAGNLAELNAWVNAHGGASAIDSCGNVSWTNFVPEPVMNCGSTSQTVVHFISYDACSNNVQSTASFVIVDHVPPLIFQPARDTIFECGNNNANAVQAWLNNHGGAKASDICGEVSWSNNFSSLADYCGLTGNAVVFFTATDECGNSSFTSAAISIEDHTAPVIDTGAHDLILQCGANDLALEIQNWLDDHGGARASDLCGNVNWTNIVTSPLDTCFADSSLITFTALDECGNSASTQAWLIISDSIMEVPDSTVFAPIGATWYYGSTSAGAPWLENTLSSLFLVEKDTLMLGYVARIIGCFVNDSGQLVRRNDLTKYVATVGQQVYYKVGEEFVLLYDFGAQPGDTIHSKVEPFELSLGCNDVDSITDFSYVIDSVKIANVDGEDLAAQYVHSLDETEWGFWDEIPIYERMGNWGWGGYWWGRGYGCIFEAGYLRCYVDDEITWHSSSSVEQYGCDYLSTPVIFDSNLNKLFPNPTTDIISLSGEGKFVAAYSLDGRPAKFHVVEKEMDLSGNSPGIYIVKIEHKGQAYFARIVLQ
ncbi:MAG TPA: T9SS type A sorting domain-containing protein, partial [Saprospiraceae bacterium]|nr:T9SS type A sorting domain-containing protein [Saprospiraceae bacterium]